MRPGSQERQTGAGHSKSVPGRNQGDGVRMAVELESLQGSADVPSIAKTVFVDNANGLGTLLMVPDVFFAGAEKYREVTVARLTVR